MTQGRPTPFAQQRSLRRGSNRASDLLSAEFIEECIRFAKSREEARCSIYYKHQMTLISTMPIFSPNFGGDALSRVTPTPDEHAVSEEEALHYYAGLHSEPRLLYRTGKPWHLPVVLQAQYPRKELLEVFDHPITKVWSNGLADKVVKAMDAHGGTEFDEDTGAARIPVISPVTIWIGVSPSSVTATAAHDVAQVLLVLFKDYQITDIDIDFRESLHTCKAGPLFFKPVQDLDPLVDVISPLTHALGLGISTMARLDAQGAMALYLAEGGESKNLFGLTCRHVLFGLSQHDVDYDAHPSAPHPEVLLLGNGGYSSLTEAIKVSIALHALSAEHWAKQIEDYQVMEAATNTIDENAKAIRLKTERLLNEAEPAMEALGAFYDQVIHYWKEPDARVFAIRFGGLFLIDQTKLGNGFQGNKIDLGTKLTPAEFTLKCFPRGDAGWKFRYPRNRLLPLEGSISDGVMRAPDMWDLDGNPCLLVVKNGSATGTTIGRANGVFSIVRDYFPDISAKQTSMEWAIMNYDSKPGAFSEPGDSGAIVADIRGRIGDMLTGGAGKTTSPDLSYATPFWWLLERIKANGFPDAHLGVVA
ncbi:hypothetical protein OE88DRAFT_1709888 [Heliocybe sulcata]|uniref:Uncharacterized protein n=1 Tax=Heliocybe sulcata TaxID=5364 RepID=A0A5C3NDI5_9AGAM|nr:hypothetical protein OE88DRAFT_1709888 [Heliocybe sulcata]